MRGGGVDYTGSGVETIAHLQENGRVCVMFCSYDARPRIVRLHGRGSVWLPGSPSYDEVVGRHPAHPSTRAVVTVDVDRVSDSCGYGVPVMTVVGERDLLRLSAEKRGADEEGDDQSEPRAHAARVGGRVNGGGADGGRPPRPNRCWRGRP
jgi:hypothetical protein